MIIKIYEKLICLIAWTQGPNFFRIEFKFKLSSCVVMEIQKIVHNMMLSIQETKRKDI
jgi:hypothetical protein